MGDNAVCPHGLLLVTCGQCSEELEKEAYSALADEMNDPGMVWDADKWEPSAVRQAQAYAQRHGLPWPPGPGDFDRFYESRHQ